MALTIRLGIAGEMILANLGMGDFSMAAPTWRGTMRTITIKDSLKDDNKFQISRSNKECPRH
jgi:hypothetical protein